MKPQSMTHKILARATGKKSVSPGEIVTAKVDMCFAHDPVVKYLRQYFYEEFGKDARVWDASRIALFQDHLVPAKDSASRSLAIAMGNFAEEQKIPHYYPYGKDYGICHIMMCEKGHVLPGEVVLGTDSHSVTYGAFNAFGTGVGFEDMLNVFKTGELWFRVPEIIEVRIEGELRPGVVAKDIILKVIGELGMGGASYKTLEFTGSTIEAMSAEERMTMCNMSVEAGAKNGIMAMSDAAEKYPADATDKPHPYDPVTTDSNFEYIRSLLLRAENIEPMVAYPHTPDNVHSISKAKSESIRINQVYIGSCTGAKMNDIVMVHDIIKGKKLADGLQLIVVPATSSIYRQMISDGISSDLLDAGAVIESPGCKACYGAHGGVLGDGENCLSTTNRNFRGRMGNPKSFVYLSSPFIAAQSALSGYITD